MYAVRRNRRRRNTQPTTVGAVSSLLLLVCPLLHFFYGDHDPITAVTVESKAGDKASIMTETIRNELRHAGVWPVLARSPSVPCHGLVFVSLGRVSEALAQALPVTDAVDSAPVPSATQAPVVRVRVRPGANRPAHCLVDHRVRDRFSYARHLIVSSREGPNVPPSESLHFSLI